VAAPLWSEGQISLGQTSDGQPIIRQTFYKEDNRHFLRINNAAPVEIPLIEYNALERETYEVFARAWVLFSYACLVLWQYIARRERASQNAG
jgi:hypothetical protein